MILLPYRLLTETVKTNSHTQPSFIALLHHTEDGNNSNLMTVYSNDRVI